MATVRFSDQLNKDIKQNARALHNAAIDKVRMSFATDDLGKEIHEILYSENQRTKMAKLGKDFFFNFNPHSFAHNNLLNY